MLWLCLRFTRLPLAVFGPGQQQPCAVLEGEHILLANPAAYEAGVQPGQSRSSARHLCPALQLLNRDKPREQQRLEQLALWAYHFTPEVSLCPPDALLLEIGGSLRLFRGFAPLHRGLQRGLQRRGIDTRMGLATTPLAAQWLSLQQRDISAWMQGDKLNTEAVSATLSALPLHRLPLDSKVQDSLSAMGFQQLGQVLALPRSAVQRRFGKAFGQQLSRLLGELPDPRPRFSPPPVFCAERQFNGALDNKEQLRFPMAALLGELGHYLRLRQCRVRQLHWHFDYCNGRRDRLQLPLSLPRFQPREVLGLVMLKLESLRLKGPIDSLSLYCDEFEALDSESGDLFAEPGHSVTEQHERYQLVLDKLRARLGPEALYQPLPRDEHLPELAWQRLEPGGDRPARMKASHRPGGRAPTVSAQSLPALRPLWLMSRPHLLQRRQGQLHWQGELQLLQGPERIDSHWWQQRQARDYYIARHASGGLYWVYRDALKGRWYVQGVFA